MYFARGYLSVFYVMSTMMALMAGGYFGKNVLGLNDEELIQYFFFLVVAHTAGEAVPYSAVSLNVATPKRTFPCFLIAALFITIGEYYFYRTSGSLPSINGIVFLASVTALFFVGLSMTLLSIVFQMAAETGLTKREILKNLM